MKLKLLFFIGILSVLCNTMYGQNTAPVFLASPPNRTVCPGYTAANIQYQVSDDNTAATDLVVTASAVGAQVVTFTYTQDPTGIGRAINVFPVGPIVPGIVTVTLTLSDVGVPVPNLSSTAVFTVNFEDIAPPVITSSPLLNTDVTINSGDCGFSIPDYTSLLVANDNCSGVVITQDPVTGFVLSNHNTSQLIVLTATDNYGNTASQSFTITLKDETPPTVIAKNITVQLDGSGNVTILDDAVNDGSTDNCTIAAYSLDKTAFSCADVGLNTVVLTVTDGAGNTASSTAIVTVEDKEAPVITCAGPISVGNDSGTCSATVTIVDATATDNCPTGLSVIGTRSDSLLLSDLYPKGTTTIVWTATDASGNSSSCTQTITVNDTENPTAIAQNKTVYLDNAGNATISTTDIDNVSVDNCDTSVSLSLDVTSFDCSKLGANTVTLTVTDDAGNVASATATVTVIDNIKPVITASGDQTVSNDTGVCGANVTVVAATASDNCLPMSNTPTGVRSDSLLLSDVYPVGTTTITWTVDDNSGNTASTTQTVTVNDTEKPLVTSSGDQTVSNDLGKCGALVTVSATATDNCLPMSNTPSGVRSDSPLTLSDEYPLGTTTITWTVTDNNGNTASTTQTVTVNDTEIPTAIAQNKTVYLDNAGNATISTTDIDNVSVDNCDTSVSLSLDVTSFDCSKLGANTVTLTVTDDAGNVASATATVTVIDNIKPVITASGDQTVSNDAGVCGALVTVSATATDNCLPMSNTPSGVRSDSLLLSDLYPVGTTTITWTVDDNSGNTASTTQTVTVNDVEDPVFASTFSPVTVNNDLGVCTYDTAQLLVPTVSDNCTPFNGLVTVSPASLNVSAGPDHTPSTVTWTATDNYGNTVSATQLVTVQDLELPIMRTKNITKYFDANGQITILPEDIDDGSTDNSGTLCFTKVVVPNILYCGNKGDNSVVLTGTDLWGNQHYKEATVTAVDNINPIITAPVDVALNTNTGCTWVGSLALPTTADNCSVLSVANDAPTAFLIGDTTVTWTVTDTSGNTATATQKVTVSDAEKPNVVAKIGYVVTLDNTGNATITATDVNNGSTDNCGIATLVVTPDTFTCSNIGSNNVTLTATDESGNTAVTTVTITVQDTTAPLLVTKPFTATLSSTGIVSILASDVVASSSDACGIKSTVVSPNAFTCANLGANTVTITVTDNNGNVTTGTAVVTVVDTTKPTISVTNIIVNTNSGCTWNGTLALPTTADNCSVISVTSDKVPSFAYPIGVTTVNWIVTDAAGNTETVTQTVTVNDVEKPIALANDFTVTLNGAGSTTITAVQVNNNSSDNCGIATTTISKSSFDCTNVGPNTVVLTVTDNSGNVSTVNANVTVQDSTVPVVITKPYTLQLNATGNGSIVVADVNNGSSDACGIKSMTVSPNSFTCANVGANTVTLTVTDINNNVSTGIATVTVEDKVLPVVTTKNITVQLSASGTALIVASDVNNGSNDSCGVKTVTVSPSSFTCANVGANTVTLTVTDNNNNVQTGTATVTVQDKVAPIVIAKDISLNLNAAGTVSITPADVNDGSSDACGIASYTLSKSTFNCSNIGLNSVILTATDVNGNVSLPTTVLVTVSDKIAPNVITKNITVQLNAAGIVSIVAADVNNGSTDACGIASYSIDKTSFSCSDTDSAKTVTLTVIDIYGNVGTGTALVTVKDQILPVARTRDIVVQLNASGTVSINASDINNGSTDNCSIASYALSKSSFNCSNVGTNIITLTATDPSGNNSIPAQATVIVEDKLAPVVKTKNITVQLNASGTVSIVPADVNNSSSDNCSITSLTLSKDTFTCDNVGSNVITLTAIDPSGNVSSTYATVTVQDKIAPVVVTKNIELVLDHGSVSIVPADVLVSATDACGVNIASYSLSKDTFTITDVLASPVTITVYATDINGNVGSAPATITFPIPITATQVITPNGDGINDTWVVENITNHQNSVVRVFNRWGSLVYSAKNYQNDWDGKLNGSDVTVPDGGSYYYQIDLKGTGNVDSEGWLYISRQ